MNILITGASGFIGRAFLRKFTEHRVYALYRHASFRTEETKIFCDLSTPSHVVQLKKYLADKNIGALFHFAATTPFSRPSEEKDYRVDRVIAEQVSGLCNDLDIPKIIYTSGWNVYDVTAPSPWNEATPCHPATDYGQAKYDVERGLQEGIRTACLIILRLSTVYGPGQIASGLIPNFMRDAFAEGVIRPRSLKTKRDYLYVDDLLGALENTLTFSQRGTTVINIGSGKSFSVEEVAEKIQAIAGEQFKKKILVEVAGNIQESLPADNVLNIAKARETLGFSPQIILGEGLARFARWKYCPVILMDLDGTLLDVSERWYRVHHDVAETMRFRPLEKRNYLDQKRDGVPESDIIGQSDIDRHLIPDYLQKRAALLESQEYLRFDMLKSSALRALENLSRAYPLVLVTKRRERQNCLEELRAFCLENFFQEIIITESLSKKEAVSHLLQGFPDRNFLVIGDTEDDVQLARDLETTSIIVKDGVRSEKYLERINADILVDSVGAAEETIKKIISEL